MKRIKKYKIQLFIMIFMILMSNCNRVVKNINNFYLKNRGQAFGPRNGVEKGSVILSCDIRDYGLLPKNVKDVYITTIYNTYSEVGSRNTLWYEVKFRKVKYPYVFPLKMQKIASSVYQKKLILPDIAISYYFNFVLHETNISSYNSRSIVKRDKMNVALELSDSYGHDSKFIISGGVLDRIYDLKVLKYLGVDRVIPKEKEYKFDKPVLYRKRIKIGEGK